MRAGIGLRFQHHQAVLETRAAIGWFEIHPENYFGGGTPLSYLERIRRDYPLSFHGVGLSLGSAEGIDRNHLGRLRDLVTRFEPGLVSEHLSWSVVGGHYLANLLPLPMTEESLDVVCRNTDAAQTCLGRRILVENPSSYLRYRHSVIPEWDFLATVAQKTGCGVLCDVNNICVSAVNHGWKPSTYLAALDPASVEEIHLAGHSVKDLECGGSLRIDDHASRVCPEVWALFAQALARFGRVPTLIEWDTDVPPLAYCSTRRRRRRRCLTAFQTELAMPRLLELQQAMYRSLAEREDREAASHIVAGGLAPEARLSVYRNTFIGALTNALRLCYPAIYRLVGAEFFAGAAARFIQAYPPASASLDDCGGEFAAFLADFPPTAGLAYLAGVAGLEWAVSRALHALDTPALNPKALAEIDPAEHGRICFMPHPAVGLVCDDAPVDLIWRAVLDRDDAAMGAIDLAAGPVWLLVERGLHGVEITRLDPAAWRFAADLFAGRPIGTALADAAPANAAELIAGHLLAGRFVGFELTKFMPIFAECQP